MSRIRNLNLEAKFPAAIAGLKPSEKSSIGMHMAQEAHARFLSKPNFWNSDPTRAPSLPFFFPEFQGSRSADVSNWQNRLYHAVGAASEDSYLPNPHPGQQYKEWTMREINDTLIVTVRPVHYSYGLFDGLDRFETNLLLSLICSFTDIEGLPIFSSHEGGLMKAAFSSEHMRGRDFTPVVSWSNGKKSAGYVSGVSRRNTEVITCDAHSVVADWAYGCLDIDRFVAIIPSTDRVYQWATIIGANMSWTSDDERIHLTSLRAPFEDGIEQYSQLPFIENTKPWLFEKETLPGRPFYNSPLPALLARATDFNYFQKRSFKNFIIVVDAMAYPHPTYPGVYVRPKHGDIPAPSPFE